MPRRSRRPACYYVARECGIPKEDARAWVQEHHDEIKKRVRHRTRRGRKPPEHQLYPSFRLAAIAFYREQEGERRAQAED